MSDPLFRALPLNRRAALAGLGLTIGALALARPLGATGDAPPQLTDSETRILSSVADTIIPKTDTEGAIGAGVIPFVALIVTAWMDPGQRDAFRDELQHFAATSARDLGGAFAEQPQPVREAYLTKALTEAQAAMKTLPADTHAPFLVWMKRLTLHGYYTSEIGASRELELNLAPGTYEACHHMAPGDHSFSLDRRQTPMAIDLQSYQPK